MVRGLLETEPLHFTCSSASDGTRIERADASSSYSGNNKFTYCTYPEHNQFGFTPLNSNNAKKQNVEWFLSEMAEVVTQAKIEKSINSNNNVQGKSGSVQQLSDVYEMAFFDEGLTSDDQFTKLSEYFVCLLYIC